MQDADYAARIDAVKQRAHGRWSEVLAAAGIEERILRHRNGPCPSCGGTDRFQYTDKFGEGNYHCRQCGPGGGFKLLQAVRGVDFHAALCEVERCLGILPAAAACEAGAPAASGERMRRLVQRIWDEARPVVAGDEVDRYLRGRGLTLHRHPPVLRFHPSLGYFEKGADGKSRQIAAYPAMLALIQAPDGQAVTLHRTYLRDGRKLDAADAKKVLSAGIHGAAVRLFDAGVGDGTVLARVMRTMHARFPTMPFYIAGKEISLEDIRLTLEKLPDRFFEHPASVVVLTNLFYTEAPWLRVKSPAAANSLVWKEVALTGNSGHEFEEQITDLQPFLSENWNARVSEKTGNPVYERPVVLVLYREDHRFLLDPIIPRPGTAIADYDLVIASQPYRLRVPAEQKAKRVIAPLARALGPGGRMIAIHSHGNDPGQEIIQNIWPDDNPYLNDRHDILKAVKDDLGNDKRDLNFNAYSDARSIFRYDMHTLPSEVSGSIGTSTLLAAWNAAIYVAQIEDQRLDSVVKDGSYIEATRDVLHRNNGLWFLDESYVISRRRG